LSNDNGDVTLTCADSKGNTYVKRGDVADTSSNGDERYVWFVCDSATHALSSTDTITVTGSGTDYNESLFWELTGSTGYLTYAGNWQQGISGSSANNLNTGSLACGSASSVFVLACSMNSTGSGTTPYYPIVGTGLTNGGNWFKFDQAGNVYTAVWGYGTFASPGTFSAKFTSSSGSSSDNYVTSGIAFGVSSGGGGSAALAGPAPAIASAAGALLTTIALIGGGGGSLSTGSGSLTTSKPLGSAPAASVITGQGSLRVGAALTGAARSVVSSGGGFVSSAPLAGTGRALVGSQAALTTGVSLSGQAFIPGQAVGVFTASTVSGLSFGIAQSAHAGTAVTNITTTPLTSVNGSGFVIGVISRNGVSPTVADSYGNAYVQIGTTQVYQGGQACSSLWLCSNGVGGANHTASAFQGTPADLSVYFQEVRNNAGYGVLLDALSQVDASTSPYTSGSINTVHPQEVVLSFFAGFSAQNPATLTTTLGNTTNSQVNGSTGNEALGALSGAIYTMPQTGLTASWTQASNPADASVSILSFYATPVPGIFVGGAASNVAASGALTTTTAFPASQAAGLASAAGALTNFASIVLTTPATVGIGSFYDPYLWEDEQPFPGCTAYWDPTYLTVRADGSMRSTAVNVRVQLQFVDPAGNTGQAVLVITSGEVGVAQGLASATGSLTTVPSVFGGLASAVSSASGTIVAGIPLAGAAVAVATGNGDTILNGINLNGAAYVLVNATPTLINQVAVFTGPACATVSAAGNLVLTATLAGGAQARVNAAGVLSHGAQLVGPAPVVATGGAAFTAAIRPSGAARGLASATGALLTGSRLTGAAGSTTTGTGALVLRAALAGRAQTLVAAPAALSAGAGFTGAARAVVTAAGAPRVGAGLNGQARAVVTARGGGQSNIQLAGAAYCIIYSDPELTTDQSPVGMYHGDPNLVIGPKFYQNPGYVTLGPTEQRIITCDYTADLAEGETLVGVAIAAVENTAGSDPMLVSLVSGLLSFNVGQTQVLVPVNGANGLLDNDYYITVTCATSNPQKVLDRFVLVMVRS
jgi:hypothetical protein